MNNVCSEFVPGLIFVLFNPSDDELQKIIQYCHVYPFVCVVDNSEKPVLDFNNTSAHYIHNRNRGGIAGAFNRGFDYFIKCGKVMRVYLFDQDSIIPSFFFEKMSSFMFEHGCHVACPSFFDVNSRSYGSFIKMDKYWYHHSNDGRTHFCISSGTCISVMVYVELGGFNENLVIDHVDTEFCLKALMSGVDIFFNELVVLEHSIGNRESRRFLGLTIKPNHHSAIRKYYIVRNGTYLSLKYFHRYKSFFIINVMRVFHEYLSVLLFEKNKLNKLFLMTKGIFHALIGRLGLYQ